MKRSVQPHSHFGSSNSEEISPPTTLMGFIHVVPFIHGGQNLKANRKFSEWGMEDFWSDPQRRCGNISLLRQRWPRGRGRFRREPSCLLYVKCSGSSPFSKWQCEEDLSENVENQPSLILETRSKILITGVPLPSTHPASLVWFFFKVIICRALLLPALWRFYH